MRGNWDPALRITHQAEKSARLYWKHKSMQAEGNWTNPSAILSYVMLSDRQRRVGKILRMFGKHNSWQGSRYPGILRHKFKQDVLGYSFWREPNRPSVNWRTLTMNTAGYPPREILQRNRAILWTFSDSAQSPSVLCRDGSFSRVENKHVASPHSAFDYNAAQRWVNMLLSPCVFMTLTLTLWKLLLLLLL